MNNGDVPMMGVYTLGNYAKNYPLILDLTYPISERDGDDFVTSGIEIGAISICGDNIFVSWYNHNTNTFGVDKIDYENKLNGAYFITKLISLVREEESNYTNFGVAYCSLPEDVELLLATAINIFYSVDYGSTWNQVTTRTDTDRQIVSGKDSVSSAFIQMKVVAETYSRWGPVIESANMYTS